jgi:hypothetical protein
MKSPSKALVVAAPLRHDDGLRIVEVGDGWIVLSTGEELIVKPDKLRYLCEQLAQEQVAVTVRTWWTRDGVELRWVHRER